MVSFHFHPTPLRIIRRTCSILFHCFFPGVLSRPKQSKNGKIDACEIVRMTSQFHTVLGMAPAEEHRLIDVPDISLAFSRHSLCTAIPVSAQCIQPHGYVAIISINQSIYFSTVFHRQTQKTPKQTTITSTTKDIHCVFVAHSVQAE